MKLKNEVKLEHLTEKNRKILDLDNIEFILSKYEESQVLIEIIKKVSKDREINRILIIGDNLISIYAQLRLSFPDAQYYIANKSKDVLKSFKENYKNQNKYSTCILDVVNGVSLHDFIYNNSTFDLVIANKIYPKVKKKKRYFSAKFLYKFYLRPNGILCLVNYIKNSKKQKFKISESAKLTLEKNIPVKKEKYSIQFMVYTKNHKYM